LYLFIQFPLIQHLSPLHLHLFSLPFSFVLSPRASFHDTISLPAGFSSLSLFLISSDRQTNPKWSRLLRTLTL
jgi:hypothetical protein